MTTKTAATPTPDALLAKLQGELEEIEMLRVPAQREVDAHLARTEALTQRIHAIQAASTTLRGLAPLAPEQEWLDHLTVWRKTLCDELLALPRHIRDRADIDRQQNLSFSIKLIDFGCPFGSVATLAPTRLGELMAEAGYATSGPELRGQRGWRGSLEQVGERIRALTKERTAAQAALDGALATDEERAEREAEAQQYRDALNSLHVTVSPDGMGYIVVDEEGDVRDLTTLTPIEREAFERADAVERQYRQGVVERQSG